jgi:hypothetical protein
LLDQLSSRPANEKNWLQQKKSHRVFEAIWMTIIGVPNAKSCFLDIGEMSQSWVLTQPVLDDNISQIISDSLDALQIYTGTSWPVLS